jgi:hypothetical protein
MKKLALCTAISAAAIMMSQTALADRVKGSARADFASGELVVPCVVIDGFDDSADGQYFDIILDRRGNSFNYELSFAEPEDTAICEELANYAIFIDDDEEESDDDADDDDSDDSDDDDSDDDSEDVANLFASCEVRHEEAELVRSKVKVKAKDLIAGDYYAIVTSGDNSIQSETRSISDDEVEFEFDSDADDVLEGAEAIEAGFIQGESVTAELVDAATDDVLLSETVSCLVKNKNN